MAILRFVQSIFLRYLLQSLRKRHIDRNFAVYTSGSLIYSGTGVPLALGVSPPPPLTLRFFFFFRGTTAGFAP